MIALFNVNFDIIVKLIGFGQQMLRPSPSGRMELCKHRRHVGGPINRHRLTLNHDHLGFRSLSHRRQIKPEAAAKCDSSDSSFVR